MKTYPAPKRHGKRRGQPRDEQDSDARRRALAERKAARRGTRAKRGEAPAPAPAGAAPAPVGDVGRVLARAMGAGEAGDGERPCFNCDGTGQMCNVCGESQRACKCDEDEPFDGLDCDSCDGTGEASKTRRGHQRSR